MNTGAVESRLVINDLDVGQLSAVAQSSGITAFTVNSEWRGRTHVRSYIVAPDELGAVRKGAVIDTDLPRTLGGAGRFASPVEFALAAFNATLVSSYAAQAALVHVHVDAIEAKAEVQLEARNLLTPQCDGAGAVVRCELNVTSSAEETVLTAVDHACLKIVAPLLEWLTAMGARVSIAVKHTTPVAISGK